MNNNNSNNANQLLPGQPLRIGVDLIADKKAGALIVIGSTTKLEKISSGGLTLNECAFSPEMLSELSKMDGAIVVNESVTKILKAMFTLTQVTQYQPPKLERGIELQNELQ